MNREYLKSKFNEAIEKEKCICVEVTIPGQELTEFIINKTESLKNKLDFYCKAYTENLVHAMNDKVKIVSIHILDSFDLESEEK